jgi:hypothetical protein
LGIFQRVLCDYHIDWSFSLAAKREDLVDVNKRGLGENSLLKVLFLLTIKLQVRNCLEFLGDLLQSFRADLDQSQGNNISQSVSDQNQRNFVMSLDDLHFSLSHHNSTWAHDNWFEVAQGMKLKRKVSPSSMACFALLQSEHLSFNAVQSIIHLVQSLYQNSLWNRKNRSDFESNWNLKVLSKLLTKNETFFVRVVLHVGFVLPSLKVHQI